MTPARTYAILLAPANVTTTISGRYAIKGGHGSASSAPPIVAQGEPQFYVIVFEITPDPNISKLISLQPVTIVTPNSAGIYAPSGKLLTIPYVEFLQYADHSFLLNISFETDGLSNARQMTAYGIGRAYCIVADGDAPI